MAVHSRALLNELMKKTKSSSKKKSTSTYGNKNASKLGYKKK